MTTAPSELMVTCATIHAAFEAAAERWPERAFLRVLLETAGAYGIEAGDVGYGELCTRAGSLADDYQQAGVKTGARVALLLENRPAFFEHWFALNALGASVVPVNPDLRAAELEYIFAHSEPVIAVAIDQRVDDLRMAVDVAGIQCEVITVATSPATVQVREIVSEDSTAREREAAILYTSGTTGQPKGCVLSNLYFLNCGAWYSGTGGLCAISNVGECMLTPLPLFHMNAMACSTMAMMAVGGTLTVLDRFHPSTWWQSVRESKASCVHYLGVVPTMLMSAPVSDADQDHNVRFGFGAGIDKRLHAAFESRFGFPLIEAWAMTETGNGAVVAANHEPRKVGLNIFGRPASDVEVRLVTDDGRAPDTDEPGELLVRRAGANPRYGFFTEYYKDPQATEAAWEGGWFHTGDIVQRNADGDMVFVDRKNNVIRRSGENIAAIEVESVLMRHPDIRAAAVSAVPDEVRGDEVFACIVAQDATLEGEAQAHKLVDWMLSQLAYYKAPGYVAFVETLPLTSTQKVQRGELRKLALDLCASEQCIDTRALKRRQRDLSDS